MPQSYLSSTMQLQRGTHICLNINILDQIQRRGARYVCNNYCDRTLGRVTKIIQDLGWQSLQEKREDHRLTLLYKLQNSILDIDPEPTLKPEDSRTRCRSRLQQSAAISTAFNNSFYPQTIRQWNKLPVFVTNAASPEGFEIALANHRATPSMTL